MKNGILDLFDKLTIKESLAVLLEQTEIKTCHLDINANTVEIVLACGSPFSRDLLYSYAEAIKAAYHLNDIKISFYSPGFTPDAKYIGGLISGFVRKHGGCRPFLSHAEASVDGNSVTVSNIIGGETLLNQNHFKEFLCGALFGELCREFEVNLEFKEFNEAEYLERREKEQQKISAAEAAKAPVSAPTSPAYTSGLLYGRPIPGPPVPISSMELSPDGSSPQTYIIAGEVLTYDVREIKGNPKFGSGTRSSITFALGDDDWACSCNLFADSDRLNKVLASVGTGKRVKVSGTYEADKYARKAIVKVRSVELLEAPPIRMDNSDEKRVELHLHTKMSAMDAVTSASDLVKRAAKWGHKAIAITDHGVAQAFPNAHNAAKALSKSGTDIKVIYGIEGYLINDTRLNPCTADLCPSGSYVVFDIETTGLSPKECRITEIGAIKIENGEFTDKFSQLINPEIPIPPNITELTGISDEMVSDKPKIDEVLPKFLEFCKGCAFVAHNASFDCGFIRYNATELGLEFHNKAIDTLRISRELYPNERKHSLDTVCRRLGVSLENHHRAVDDATATAEVFLKFMDAARKNRAENSEINISTRPELLKSQKYHIILLAKNYVGLKNLYKLISKSNLEYFYKKPIMPKSVIEQFRDGIIIGSACEAGELYRAILDKKSNEELLDIASFYDYLEIQPLGNNAFMLRNGTVASKSELQDINRKIIGLGDKLNLPTVATCDVHFMDPEDAMYRRVLLGAQGFSDADEQAPLYLRTTEEMLEEFSYLGDRAKEVVITNTNKIADMCEKIQPVKDGSYPPSIENCEQDLVDMCHAKAHRIYGDVLPKIVQERMDKELDCIVKYGYSVMYMIAHKLVKKSNDAGYLVGSRGSVGSSFAAFLSDITEVNALCPHYVCPNCKNSEWFENGEYPTGIDMPDKNCPVCGTKYKKERTDDTV